MTLARARIARPVSGLVGPPQQWDRGKNFGAVRADWLARSSGQGRDIRVRLAEREVTGRFESLDAAGRLILRFPSGGTESISAGDVMPFHVGSSPDRDP